MQCSLSQHRHNISNLKLRRLTSVRDLVPEEKKHSLIGKNEHKYLYQGSNKYERMIELREAYNFLLSDLGIDLVSQVCLVIWGQS